MAFFLLLFNFSFDICYVYVIWLFASFLFSIKYWIFHGWEVIWKKRNFSNFSRFFHIYKGSLLSQFLCYKSKNCYLHVNFSFEQVLFFMFIKNVNSFADIHNNSIFHGGHLGFFKTLKGENFTPALGWLVRPHTIIIWREKKFIRDAEVNPIGRQTNIKLNYTT